MSENSLRYLIGITMIPGIGSITARKLIAYTGSAEAVFSESKKNLIKIPDIGEKIAKAVAGNDVLKLADKEIEYAEKNDISVYTCFDKSYPTRLKECDDAPLVLYIKGAVDLNAQNMLGVVGTRNATQYGKDCAEKIIKDLSDHGHAPVIVSGLAYGIDIAAHRAAIKNNLPTIGVIAHGLDTLYPASHRQTSKTMMSNGGLVTEFPTKTIPEKPMFVRRNRIIAGLSDATLVVESGEKGGALITAEYANSYNRDVLAVPGKNTDHYSRGCNNLIKKSKAHLVETAEDIEYILNWTRKDQQSKAIQKELFATFTDEEQKLIDLLKQQPEIYIDEICFNSGMPVNKVSSLLLNLELNGAVKSMPGKRYQVV
jgi:DNA processing protein